MTWPEFREDLGRRKASRRTVRISEASFVKLADLLCPALQKNERFGSEYLVMYPGALYTIKYFVFASQGCTLCNQLRCKAQHSLEASAI